ncbi:DUF3570 domain-containing protein [Gilvimarinus algae]|uniref:DUF3570 domain-containing protein n=1 Tax=Gilvimarinus algae TaxID=3058037 RepID=A0ABT8TJ28_9GAMM|nr:DUF3570 domain-containing protein [Gilvimarinus sp. SDUM040014]MDO3383083.1 DUF3570 domain-containing protein [Gilvimarinus sp. SDUM040014]
MQLTRHSSTKAATVIALASSALLASDDSQSANSRQWSTQTAVLSYSENGRISVNQGLIQVEGASSENTINVKLGYDVVSGASENGAVPTAEPQTFTSPSGVVDEQTAANERPSYTIDRHPRQEVSLGFSQNLNRYYSVSLSGRYSTEATYISRSVGLGNSYYSNNKNTQWTLSLNYEDASIRPYGGAALAGARVISRADFASEEAFEQQWQQLHSETHKARNTTSINAAVNQIISRNALAQVSYQYSHSRGYHNDSQKMVSVIDAAGDSLYNRYEVRPEQRQRHSAFARLLWHFAGGRVLDTGFRFYTDNWGVRSHTLSAGVQFELGSNWRVEPQLRWYQQEAADFFSQALRDNQTPFFSADYRLAPTTNITYGINADYQLGKNQYLSLRLAYYQMSPEQNPDALPGYLNTVDLTPDVDATLLSISYAF